jgi:hypothetical protein
MKCELKHMKYSYIHLMKSMSLKETLVSIFIAGSICAIINYCFGTIGLVVLSCVLWIPYLCFSFRNAILYCKEQVQ